MEEIKAILIDDERKPRELLRLKLQEYKPEVKILAEAETIDMGYEKIHQMMPDLVFLDVNMPGGSGFELLKRFDKLPFEVIFATGYDEFALEAIKYCAIGYLIKPYKTSDLIKSVDEAKYRISLKNFHERYQNFTHLFNSDVKKEDNITVSTSGTFKVIKIENIVRCEGWDKYTNIFLKDGEKILSTCNIGKYWKSLEQHGFFHCHKSHIINKKFVRTYDKKGNITMDDNTLVPLARRRKSEFLSMMQQS